MRVRGRGFRCCREAWWTWGPSEPLGLCWVLMYTGRGPESQAGRCLALPTVPGGHADTLSTAEETRLGAAWGAGCRSQWLPSAG